MYRTPKATLASFTFRAVPVMDSRQNRKLWCTARLSSQASFSNSRNATRADFFTTSPKNCAVVASVPIPVGSTIPLRPEETTTVRAVSAKTA